MGGTEQLGKWVADVGVRFFTVKNERLQRARRERMSHVVMDYN